MGRLVFGKNSGPATEEEKAIDEEQKKATKSGCNLTSGENCFFLDPFLSYPDHYPVYRPEVNTL